MTQNERRAKARKAGICVECQFNRALPDRIRCATCLDYQAKRAKAKRAKDKPQVLIIKPRGDPGFHREVKRVFQRIAWLFGTAK